jgi:hypothetical protein
MAFTLRILSTVCLLLGLVPQAHAFTRKQKCTVRCHMEVDGTPGDPFATSVQLINPPKRIFIESAPSLSERQIRAVRIYPTANGSWAALIQLDNSGRLTLQNLSNSNRGRTMVVYVGTAKSARQVIDLEIDSPVSDGLLPIPRGLTYAEALELQKSFAPLKPQNPGH